MAKVKNKLKKQILSIFGPVRNKVQWVIFSITILAGIQFSVFINSINLSETPSVPKPQAVEGFLPIGSLISLKYLLITGIVDHIHPAGIVILIFAVLTSFLFKKAFCSWFCPIGTVSEWFWKLGYRIFGKNYKLPTWIDYPIRSLKYLLMTFFVLSVLKMDMVQIKAFLGGEYWKIADVKMLFFFTKMSGFSMVVLLTLAFASIFVRNFWCRYLCPYGAFLGIFSFISPSRISRNENSCTDCGLCKETCPAYLPVDKKPYIISAECTGCLSCTDICPVKDTLKFETLPLKSTFWTPQKLAILILGGFFILVIVSKAMGIWESHITPSEIFKFLPYIDFIGH